VQNNSRITLTTVTLHQRYLSGKEYTKDLQEARALLEELG